jgi:hypothetical protein
VSTTTPAKRYLLSIGIVLAPLLVIALVVGVAVGYSSHHHGTTVTTLPSSAPAAGHRPGCITLESDSEKVTTAVLSYANTTGSAGDALHLLSVMSGDIRNSVQHSTGTSVRYLQSLEYLVASVESALSSDKVTQFQTQWSELSSLMHQIKSTC